MLDPVLEVLYYLHAKGFVHGHIKPSNIMVVNNELKVSVDDIQVARRRRRLERARDIYDAPKSDAHPITPAADSWSLGATLVEILTQHPPRWNESSSTVPVVPESIPQPFLDIARECLRVDPTRRCTLEDVKALLEGKTRPKPQVSLPATAPPNAARKAPAPKLRIVPLIVALVVLIGIITILQLRGHKEQPASPTPVTTQQSSPTPAVEADPQGDLPSRGPVIKGEVTQHVLPEVPPAGLRTIQGKVQVAIRVTVDAKGTVTNAQFESPGSSKYFARFALESARSWKFKPAQVDGQTVSSVWALHYMFRNSGIEVAPVEVTP